MKTRATRARSTLARLASETRRTPERIVEEALSDYILDHEAYLAAVDKAVAEADQGAFISGDAVMHWLNSWASGNPVPAPQPDVFPGKPE